jgi:hypothetical protein
MIYTHCGKRFGQYILISGTNDNSRDYITFAHVPALNVAELTHLLVPTLGMGSTVDESCTDFINMMDFVVKYRQAKQQKGEWPQSFACNEEEAKAHYQGVRNWRSSLLLIRPSVS